MREWIFAAGLVIAAAISTCGWTQTDSRNFKFLSVGDASFATTEILVNGKPFDGSDPGAIESIVATVPGNAKFGSLIAALGGKGRQNGAMVYADFAYREIGRCSLQGLTLTRCTFTELTQGSTEPWSARVEMAPSEGRFVAGSRSTVKAPPRQKMWLPCNFRVEISGKALPQITAMRGLTLQYEGGKKTALFSVRSTDWLFRDAPDISDTRGLDLGPNPTLILRHGREGLIVRMSKLNVVRHPARDGETFIFKGEIIGVEAMFD